MNVNLADLLQAAVVASGGGHLRIVQAHFRYETRFFQSSMHSLSIYLWTAIRFYHLNIVNFQIVENFELFSYGVHLLYDK